METVYKFHGKFFEWSSDNGFFKIRIDGYADRVAIPMTARKEFLDEFKRFLRELKEIV